MAPVGSRATREVSISPDLAAAIKSSFGTVEDMKTALNEAGLKVFGSGWSWLCYTGERGRTGMEAKGGE
jgi:Fe-Mn family superoxide dismutase